MRSRTRHLAFFITVSTLATSAPAQPIAPALHAPWRGYNVGYFPGGTPSHLAHGDLNGDGRTDVVVALSQFGAPGIGILLNSGDGAFNPRVEYNLPFNLSAAEVALLDFDADGDLDIVATVPGAWGDQPRIALWRNNGSGAFTNYTFITTGVGPVGIAIADFTGDGKPDLITANHGGPGASPPTGTTISLLKHNGQTGAAAAFLPPLHFAAGSKPYRLSAGDLDGDGDIDLVIARNEIFGQHITILTNLGSGSFSAPLHLPAFPGLSPPAPRPVLHLSDIDLDGDLDILTGGIRNGAVPRAVVGIYRNLGGGQFDGAQIIDLNEFTDRITSVETALLNADQSPEIIAATWSTRAADGFCILTNDGSGHFLTPDWHPASKGNTIAAPADVDGDGDADILCAAQYTSALTVHTNHGDGHFFRPQRFTVGGLTHSADAADLDGDGNADIATCDGYANQSGAVRLLFGNGDATFAPAVPRAAPFNPGTIKLRDLNNDGRPDIILGPNPDHPPYRIAFAFNQGAGTFTPWTIINPNACSAGPLDVLDLNGDGFLDIVLVSPGACAGGFTNDLHLIRNNAGTAFSILPPIAGDWGYGLDTGDFNADGKTDIVNNGLAGIRIHLSNGDFTFQPPIAAQTGESSWPLHTADFDGDGHLDVAYRSGATKSSTNHEWMGLIRGTGAGAMSAPQLFRLGSDIENLTYADNLRSADINNDGLKDLLITSISGNDIMLFYSRGTPTATFDPRPERYGAGMQPRHTMVADFDHDGLQDVAAVVNRSPEGGPPGEAVVILRNIFSVSTSCYANCDQSTVQPILNIDDFTCFINEFASAQSLPHTQQLSHYANCDDSVIAPVLNVDDFTCFINQYAQGCP